MGHCRDWVAYGTLQGLDGYGALRGLEVLWGIEGAGQLGHCRSLESLWGIGWLWAAIGHQGASEAVEGVL